MTQFPWLDWPETQTLIQAFAAAKQELRFVGGAVRDSLLGREALEVDAATPARPEAVMALLEKAGIRAIPTGIDHGTITAVINKKHFEVTTLRRDVATDGRWAEVEYTDDWQQDAARRDFTINALFVSPAGELFDYFGGQVHLQPLRIIFIGEARARIEEDGLRILRFFRFSAQLSAKEFDAAALAACKEKAALLDKLSGERIAQEMLKLLISPEMAVLMGMQQAGILPHIQLPALPAALAAFKEPDALARLALWLMHGGNLEALRARWKLSAAQYETLQALMRTASALQKKPNEQEQKKLLRQTGADIFSRASEMADFPEGVLLAKNWPIPQFPVTGADLLARDFAEGKALGAKLKELEAAWEAEEYAPTREALLKRL